ncbi:MAG TPA: hypothetical protein VGN52_24560 [Burkholderiales bacterium]|jgi:hypothetical protein
MSLPSRVSSLRRLLAHAGLAFALLLAQLGMLGHTYTAHPLESRAAAQAAARNAPEKPAPGHGDARDVCSLCLAYSVFTGSLPSTFHLDAAFAERIAYLPPHAHGAPSFPFVSYASRAPPSPQA